ncbi:hypothetical protein RHGRI_012438 [Rhododendron griersonianum]|uniref:MsrB domain-containing protein n=1 Tax=Rhododendron griersonianum TaxID=479676 RepID=A0AAV6KR29_9ERIC|nr:hypothetical protein RHGRI_012438 [Rhododendron griersonianum]
METKNKSAFVDKIRCNTNLLHSFYVDPVGFSGGLALWWDDSISVSIIHSSSFHIFAEVSSPQGGNKWFLSCVYIHPDAGTRAQAWSQLRSCSRTISSPWLCIGDFNEVSSSKEKFGGLPVSSSRLEAFNGLISDCSLLDLEFKGLNYTWSNNREGSANIRERIDRALANADWRVMFPFAQVFQDAIIGSDHSPLLLDFCVSPTPVPKSFKFESMWITSPNCLPTIRDNWSTQVQGSAMFRWNFRLKALKKVLKKWSRTEFGNNKTRLAELKDQLAYVQNLAPTAENLTVQQAIHKSMEIIMAREEMYLHQRSRVRLNYGDRNSKFFYTTLIQRRQRNQILRQKALGNIYDKFFSDGVYNCAGSGMPLYKSTTKFNSGCG